MLENHVVYAFRRSKFLTVLEPDRKLDNFFFNVMSREQVVIILRPDRMNIEITIYHYLVKLLLAAIERLANIARK